MCVKKNVKLDKYKLVKVDIRKELVFATNSNVLAPISLPPNGENLDIF